MNHQILNDISHEEETNNSNKEYGNFNNYDNIFSKRNKQASNRRRNNDQDIVDIQSIGELLYDIDENNEKIEEELKRTQEIILS